MFLNQEKVREAVGVFHDEKDLDSAIAELETTAFPRQDISVLGSATDIKNEFGKDTVKPKEAEDDPNIARGISIRPEEKVIGATVFVGVAMYVGATFAAMATGDLSVPATLAAVFLGSALGGALGILTIRLLRKKLRKNIQKQLKEGGLLLWVRTPEPEKEKIARNILKKHGGTHVHIHEIP